MTLYTRSTAAAKLGCDPATVYRAAKRAKVGITLPTGQVYSEGDLSAIAAEIKPIGCPKMTAGNKLWRRRKKTKKIAKRTR